MTHAETMTKLWGDVDPFAHAPVDIQGWNEDHPYLNALADRCQVIVEIGVWKGASAIIMATRMRAGSTLIAVDHFAGSAEHWTDSSGVLPRHSNGTSRLYDVFRANVISKGLMKRIVPLPVDSAAAAKILTDTGIRPDGIYIDAAHDKPSCLADLLRWWPLLQDGGVMVVDDYRSGWTGVTEAVDLFHDVTEMEFSVLSPKCWMGKPQ